MKVIDKTLLKTYIGPFILTFLVVLFVFLMQFLWKYIDDMAGKGIEWYLILKMFFFMSFTFIPLSMPLGVLLSALITFGNLGEKNELTAMKSAGIPLYRIMQPLLIFAVFLSGLTFIVANNGVPVASLKAYTLLRDIQSQKPALNIEEGIFYRGFEDHVIRIGKKDKDNQTIYDVMLYDHSRNTGYTTLTYAQRGKMVMSSDKRYLVFTLEDGAVYDENIRYEGSIPPSKLEILRGSFKKEQVRLDLSSFKLQRTSEDFYKDSYEMLNVSQLKKQIDTFKTAIYEERLRSGDNIVKNFNSISLCYIDSLAKDTLKGNKRSPIDKKQQYTYALQAAREHTSQLEYNQMDCISREKTLWRYEIEWHRKYAIAVACVLLFFIGAPLGSFIRNGGLVVPMFLSILIFVLYWIFSTMGERMARIGVLEPWMGMWASTLILLPFSLFLIYKASVEAKLSSSASTILTRMAIRRFGGEEAVKEYDENRQAQELIDKYDEERRKKKMGIE
jgi:lipopolysaccharide export system permease protein